MSVEINVARYVQLGYWVESFVDSAIESIINNVEQDCGATVPDGIRWPLYDSVSDGNVEYEAFELCVDEFKDELEWLVNSYLDGEDHITLKTLSSSPAVGPWESVHTLEASFNFSDSKAAYDAAIGGELEDLLGSLKHFHPRDWETFVYQRLEEASCTVDELVWKYVDMTKLNQWKNKNNNN